MKQFYQLILLTLTVLSGNVFASVTIMISETGGNVVASGSGSINTTGLNFVGGGGTTGGRLQPNDGRVELGAGTTTYYNGFTGPTTFGPGGNISANFITGDSFGVRGGVIELRLPAGYVSGTPLNGMARFDGATFTSLGLTPGTYTFTMPNDTLIVQVGPAASATTNAATSITTTGATLNGTVNDNGATTSVTFNYGLTNSYGSSATATPSSIAAGAGSTAVSAALTGLACNTTYHFRVSATNSVNTTNGSDATFTTSACAVAVPTLSEWSQILLGLLVMTLLGWHFHRERSY